MSVRGKHLKHLNFIPGRLILKPGARADYKALERFHYLAGPPATWAQIWTIYHQSCIHTSSDLRKSAQICAICGHSAPPTPTPIAIAVLSYPCLNSHARERALNLSGLNPRRRQRFINQNIRTISRLIVHPTYRGLGLASTLINRILNNCPTRYTEALATMAKAHPLFKNAGMKEFPPQDPDKPTYYLTEKRRPVRRCKSITSADSFRP
jgi:GNAT superfamily N-acetyltransferase